MQENLSTVSNELNTMRSLIPHAELQSLDVDTIDVGYTVPGHRIKGRQCG